MNRVLSVFLGIFAFVGIVIGILVFGTTMKACNTASQMADKTVFNAQKHIVSYEQFRDDYQAYLRYVNSYCELTKIKDLSMEEKISKDGYYKMAMDIAQRYNANAMKFYKKVWKGDLPEKLPLNIECK